MISFIGISEKRNHQFCHYYVLSFEYIFTGNSYITFYFINTDILKTWI